MIDPAAFQPFSLGMVRSPPALACGNSIQLTSSSYSVTGALTALQDSAKKPPPATTVASETRGGFSTVGLGVDSGLVVDVLVAVGLAVVVDVLVAVGLATGVDVVAVDVLVAAGDGDADGSGVDVVLVAVGLATGVDVVAVDVLVAVGLAVVVLVAVGEGVGVVAPGLQTRASDILPATHGVAGGATGEGVAVGDAGVQRLWER